MRTPLPYLGPRLGVLAHLDVPLGSVGSTLSKATLRILRLPESVNKQTNKQTNKLLAALSSQYAYLPPGIRHRPKGMLPY